MTSANSYTTPTLIGQGIVNVRNNGSLGLVASEVQVISFNGANSASTFTLAFNGATTAPISYSTVAANLVNNIQTALTQLSTIGAGNTVVTGTTVNAIKVTFQNLLASLNEPAITVPSQPSPGTASVTTTVLGVAPETVGVASGATLQLQGGTTNLSLSQSFILNGSGVTINGSAVGAIQNLSGSNTIAGALPGTVPGTIFLGSSTALGTTVGTLTTSGIISGGGDLTKIGGGTVVLAGVDSYTGQTNISAGIVQLALASVLSATGNVTPLGSNASAAVVASGATLMFNSVGNGAQSYFDSGKPLTLNGNGLGLVNAGGLGGLNNGNELMPLGALATNSPSASQPGAIWTGNVTLNSNATIDSQGYCKIWLTGLVVGTGAGRGRRRHAVLRRYHHLRGRHHGAVWYPVPVRVRYLAGIVHQQCECRPDARLRRHHHRRQHLHPVVQRRHDCGDHLQQQRRHAAKQHPDGTQQPCDPGRRRQHQHPGHRRQRDERHHRLPEPAGGDGRSHPERGQQPSGHQPHRDSCHSDRRRRARDYIAK